MHTLAYTRIMELCTHMHTCTLQLVHFITSLYNVHFITSLFQEGLQYRSINLIRSAVSTTRLLVDGVPIGQHPLVKQLFRGVYNSRPPQPRYTQTWDVTTVLDHIAQLGENKRPFPQTAVIEVDDAYVLDKH